MLTMQSLLETVGLVSKWTHVDNKSMFTRPSSVMSSFESITSDTSASSQGPGFQRHLDGTADVLLPALPTVDSHEIRRRVRDLGWLPGGIREDSLVVYQSLVDFATFRLNMALRAFFHDQKEISPAPEDWWRIGLHRELVSVPRSSY